MLKLVAKLALAGVLTAAGPSATPAEADLTGAGASFPAPLIATWADVYRDVTRGAVIVNYQSIGSGGGIRQFLEQTVHFGATEAFLNDEQLAQARAASGGEAFNLPITLTDVVVTYNVPGLSTGVVFDGEVLAGIFLGEVVRWNDERLATLNPGLELPDLRINVVHRADGSGTTAIFTSYLSAVSSAWAERVGAGTAVEWPTGVGASGNEGVAGLVTNAPGTIGYNSLVYAKLAGIAYGYVVNAAGNVIEPSLAATSAAGDVALPDDARALIVNTEHPDGYPIAGFTWALLYENADANNAFADREQAVETVRFLAWAVTEGQELSELLGFARLPPSVVERDLARLARVKWRGENIGQAIVDGFVDP